VEQKRHFGFGNSEFGFREVEGFAGSPTKYEQNEILEQHEKDISDFGIRISDFVRLKV
jgi:hypothetical protein